MSRFLACLTLLLLTLPGTCVRAQHALTGRVEDAAGDPVAFANAALYRAADSSLVKVETTADDGSFRLADLPAGVYDLDVTFIGAPSLRRGGLDLTTDLDLGVLRLAPAAVELETATVTARRALVEVKPDRTVFNVQGTINAVGNNGLDLLRKAPGVTVDNNENINVLSRAGVLVYVDGKRMPLQGQDLTNYLRNLTAEQIDRIDIITNPGAKYEAEGNAGIIDIRLKKAENEGANGSVTGAFSQGVYYRYNVGANANYRNRRLNAFGSLNYNYGNSYNFFDFDGFQNGLLLDETTRSVARSSTPVYRAGLDLYLSGKHTLGVLVGGQYTDGAWSAWTNTDIFTLGPAGGVPATPDSVLLARGLTDADRGQNTFNVNYRYDIGTGRSLNVDLDYGRYRNDQLRDQPNEYRTPAGELSSGVYNYFDTPTDIDIYTAKLDYEAPVGAGTLSAGTKFSRVRTFNTFRFFDRAGPGGERTLNRTRSNQFDYEEDVYAAYLAYNGRLNEAWSYTAGLRAELTDATGTLTPFDNTLGQPPVALNYLSLFPNAGLTYTADARAGHTLNLAYGRRINRPDYNVLNPFRNQLSQLNYERGNPFLNPEIVDNIELGYTHAFRYNAKLAFGRTSNQITRLIGPDDLDPRASFISWDNLAQQTTVALNVSAPVQVSPKWNLYLNANGAYLRNEADYGDEGGVIDLKAWTYNIFVQNTINLPWQLTAEIGGYFSGPGIWGGVFRYEESGAFNVGLQRKFLQDRLNVKLSGNDLFLTSPWRGVSEFNGLRNVGRGGWDSRRVGLSLSYNLGNQKVKSRNRRTGLEDEAGRIN